MVREIGDQAAEEKWASDFPDFEPTIYFCFSILQSKEYRNRRSFRLSQLKRLDQNNRRRSENLI